MTKSAHACGIYAIEHLATGRMYIGQSADIPSRWWQHKHELKDHVHSSPSLQQAWDDGGLDAFRFLILEECAKDRDILVNLERSYINTLKPVFNVDKYAKASSLGIIIPPRVIPPDPNSDYCLRGHAYDEANSYINKKGVRTCRRCATDRTLANYTRKTPYVRGGPVCQKGHEWTEENTIILKSGSRQCRACAEERKKSRNIRTRERYKSGPELRERRRKDHQAHREERLAQMRQHAQERRSQEQAAKLVSGDLRKPGVAKLPDTCRKGHPWTPENTIQESKRRLCRACKEERKAKETPEHKAQRLAERNEGERSTWHDDYLKRKERASQRQLVAV